MGVLRLLSRWWGGLTPIERAVRAVLGVVAVSVTLVALVRTVRSYEHPRVQTVLVEEGALELPVAVMCPWSREGTVFNASVELQNRAGRVPPTAVFPMRNAHCFVFDLGLTVSSLPGVQGSEGVSLFVEPALVDMEFFLFVRYSAVEGVANEQDVRLLPADAGEKSMRATRTVTTNFRNQSLPVVGTWALRLSAEEFESVSGHVTKRTVALAPIQALTATNAADSVAPDLYYFFDTLEVKRHVDYVAEDWLYFLGLVGGLASVSKMLLWVSTAVGRGKEGGGAGEAAGTPLLEGSRV